MRDETVITLIFGVIALAIGAVVMRFYRRHRARVRADRDAGRYIPIVDGTGAFLFLNGPVTIVLGIAFLANGAWRARRELEEARLAAELGAIRIACVPGELTIENAGTETRVVHASVRANRAESDVDPRATTTPAGPFTLAPGTSAVAQVSLARPDACGEASTFSLGGIAAWSECTGLRVTVRLESEGGDALAEGEGACTFPGRYERLDPLLFGF